MHILLIMQAWVWVGFVPLLWILVWHIGEKRLWLKGLLASVPIAVGVGLVHQHFIELILVPIVTLAFIPNLPGTSLFTLRDGHTISILWRDVLRSSVVAISWVIVAGWR